MYHLVFCVVENIPLKSQSRGLRNMRLYPAQAFAEIHRRNNLIDKPDGEMLSAKHLATCTLAADQLTCPHGALGVEEFENLLNESPSRVGTLIGDAARTRLEAWGNTSGFTPMPADAWLNTKTPRYIYTENGGWIDMQHFMFYAGRARAYSAVSVENPVGEAVQDGFQQELMDSLLAPAQHSAYSYEDLPSDRFGAIFGAQVFDPTSSLSLSEQVGGFLRGMGGTAPQKAPNYGAFPANDHVSKELFWNYRGSFDHRGRPTVPDPIPRNFTTTPMFVFE